MMKIDIDHSPPPGIKVHFLPGTDILVVGIYLTDRRGVVYRWDNGPEMLPTVIYWDLDGPDCE